MATKMKPTNPFGGRWRIVSMEQWDQDLVDEQEEGYFEFNDKGNGDFHFGYVHGQMDCRLTTRDNLPAVEWTWDGNDEMDPAQGRGWAVIKGDELHGMIFFHCGDDSGFVAKKVTTKKASRQK
jgi:hypothetical protein